MRQLDMSAEEDLDKLTPETAQEMYNNGDHELYWTLALLLHALKQHRPEIRIPLSAIQYYFFKDFRHPHPFVRNARTAVVNNIDDEVKVYLTHLIDE